MLGTGALWFGTAYSAYEKGYIDDEEFRLGSSLSLTLFFAGLGLATVWSDVEDRRGVAVNVTPDGGVRVSKSFGW